MLALIVYIIGVVMSLLLQIYIVIGLDKEDVTIKKLLLLMSMSIFSWISVLAGICTIIYTLIAGKIGDKVIIKKRR